MIHFVPEGGVAAHDPLAEALARVASLRHALHLVERLGGRPPSDIATDARIAAAWPTVGAAIQRCIGRHSEQAAAAAEAGLVIVADLGDRGTPANPASLHRLADELRAELATIDALLTL